MAFKSLQEWGLQYSPGQLCQGLTAPWVRKFSLIGSPNFPWPQLESILSPPGSRASSLLAAPPVRELWRTRRSPLSFLSPSFGSWWRRKVCTDPSPWHHQIPRNSCRGWHPHRSRTFCWKNQQEGTVNREWFFPAQANQAQVRPLSQSQSRQLTVNCKLLLLKITQKIICVLN